jgi:hypothetical protein
VTTSQPIGPRRATSHLRARRSGHGDDDTHARSTLSTETTEVRVFYPFHPLNGSTLQIQRRPQRGDGAVSVMDRDGKRLKIPMWMLSPGSAEIRIREQAHLSREALLALSSVLAVHTQPNHDSLQPIAVDVCEGGHRDATRTDKPDDPGRRLKRARKRYGTGGSCRSDGPHADGSISSRRRKV